MVAKYLKELQEEKQEVRAGDVVLPIKDLSCMNCIPRPH